MSALACPGCAQPMERRTYARKPVGTVDVDLCFGCHAIWFDQHESLQLTPGAVIDLFADINDHREQPPRALADGCRCPKCRERLAPTQDVQRTNRFAYHRCAHGHGRLTTFVQFLREKNFVRSLSVGEMHTLRATVSQVRCSSCGAYVSVERDAQCGYCSAPLSILDADAVQRTLAELDAAEQKRRRVNPAAPIDALLAGKRFERKLGEIELGSPWHPLDLVSDALELLMRKP